MKRPPYAIVGLIVLLGLHCVLADDADVLEIKRGATFPETKHTRPANQDAKAQGHWSFEPPAAPQIPIIHNRSWVQNPIDQFVLAKREVLGLTPALPAEKYTLLRRVTYDLTGLPATADDVDAFLADLRRRRMPMLWIDC